MCSRIFQRFLFVFYNMSVIYCNSHEVKTCCKCIHLLKTVASTLFKVIYISSTFTNITTPSISINLDILQNLSEQRIFRLSYVFFKNQSITFFASFFIHMLRMINLFFCVQK